MNQGYPPVKNPLVSVVMSIFNGKQFLAEAVESILEQEFQDFEFIMIDDGSTDGSAEELDFYQKLDDRVHVYHEVHSGLVSALNRGCERACGKYIARMDADDIAMKDRLSQQVEFMEGHPEIGLLGASVEWVNGTGNSLFISSYPTKSEELKDELLLRRRCVFWHPTVLMRRDVLAKTTGYRPNVIGAEDYDLWLRIAEISGLANLEQVLLKYRIHSGQVSIQRRMEQTRSTLAAQMAAKRRKDGLLDPLDGGTEITSDALISWGIPDSEQKSEIVRDYRKWIGIMCNAGEHSSALRAAREVVKTRANGVERWQIADIHLTVSKLLWRQKKFAESVVSAIRAFLVRPLVVGRPVKRFLMGSF